MDDVIAGHFSLTSEERQFKTMLSRYPEFLKYWDFDTRTCNQKSVDSDIEKYSPDDQEKLKFFVALWVGGSRNVYAIDAEKFLDDDHLATIDGWNALPFRPWL